MVFFRGVNKKVEILLCVCCLGFQGGGRCLGLCELEAEIAGSEGGGDWIAKFLGLKEKRQRLELLGPREELFGGPDFRM